MTARVRELVEDTIRNIDAEELDHRWAAEQEDGVRSACSDPGTDVTVAVDPDGVLGFVAQSGAGTSPYSADGRVRCYAA